MKLAKLNSFYNTINELKLPLMQKHQLVIDLPLLYETMNIKIIILVSICKY